MNCQKLENLNPSIIYEEHERQFERISVWLKEYYNGYSNSDKIISLLSYWLYAYRCILVCYGIEGAKDFCRGEFGSHIRFAYSHEYGAETNLKPKKIKNTFLFQIAAGFINTAYLPGARIHSIYSKIVWRITKFVAMSAPMTVRKIRKQAIISKLIDCFDGYDASVIEKCFNDALPTVFFADQISLFVGKVLRVDCSAVSFLDFCGYENMLLFSRRLELIGRQHGGGYDIFCVDYFQLFEKKLCDQFIGWGLSCSNERQHKYPIVDSPSMSDGGGKRLIWVEHPLVPLVLFPMSPDLYSQFNNRRVIGYIYNELLAAEREFFSLTYPGELQSSDYIGMRGTELSNISGRGESVICANDVVVFDNIFASLIHYCIEHEITFVLVIGRENIGQFTEAANEWFNLLRSSELAFFDDEIHLLSRRLVEILSDQFELPANVKGYHQKRFVDLLPSGTQ